MNTEKSLLSRAPASACAVARRKLPIGAEWLRTGGAHFRVWAPAAGAVAVEIFGPMGAVERTVPLAPEPHGYFSGASAEIGVGARYKIKLDSGSFPDPASRFQPEGPHGPSQIVDADPFRWTDQAWRGRPKEQWVIYELHLGTFTPEGTWRAAAEQLAELQRLGVTVIEVMPVAEFAGRFGWGYDGVDLFAPYHVYGEPDDMREFVNRAHALGLMVILDVVYNHVGPAGNYLQAFSTNYFSRRHSSEWGEAINFDGENAGPVREFYLSNVRLWIEEYHLDGLRLDATQQIFDDSDSHILAEIGRTARAAAPGRQLCLVGENEPQDARLLRPYEKDGYGLDALWNDDFHHSAVIAATGKIDGYYMDYRGRPQEFISALKHGYLYQGQWYSWQKKRRGRPAFDLSPREMILFLENHDQVANSLRGLRLHQMSSPGRLRALTALLLLAPGTPMLFQGQEFGASSPFLYFADHEPELARLVARGRREFLSQFRSVACHDCDTLLTDPGDPETFRRCKLDFSQRERHRPVYRLHQDLLRVRREDPTIAAPAHLDGAVLDTEAFVIRYFSHRGDDDRLLLVNLGPDLFLHPAPEPLLAPVEGMGWAVRWSSESPDYGGVGTPPLETTANWIIPGQAAVLLRPHENNVLPAARLSEKN